MRSKIFVLLSLAVTQAVTTLYAQRRAVVDTVAAPKASSVPLPPPRPASGPKPYNDVITSKAVSDSGLFLIHRIDDNYFFEIGDTLLGRDILVVNRIAKASAGMRQGMFGFAGDEVGQTVIRFEKGPNYKMFLRTISYAEYAKDSTSPMFTAVNKSNIQPISASFDIKAYTKDSTGSVVDMTSYINGDNDVLFFSSRIKTGARIGSLQSDKSYVTSVKSYPINIEIVTVKTYSRGGGMPAGSDMSTPQTSGNITVEMNSSLVMLPKRAMQPRYYDPRVGYFSVGYTDFDANPQGVESIRLVKRWRLEPKAEDWEKYKRGDLVEPKKQIVFYIDPATPEKWVPYLIQGVNDWQTAFEKAGFKNAIVAKRAPSKMEDPDWTLEDARYCAIVYKPSDVPNASGPSISDPRSGEIMESHINWYHNVMKLVHDWYFIQCAPNDTGAQKMIFDDELMGELIRFVSSHEVGHTLGLRHNYGSSSTVPVENLRNKAWVEANGHTPSIMDYARFNYVAQPEDKIDRKGLMGRIGDYDHWAIEWGYRLYPQFYNENDERTYLKQLTIAKLNDKRLWFGTESNFDDPRSQSEQVGDDAVKGSLYGIKNLKRILPNLVEWTKEPNRDYSSLRNMYNELLTQYNRYMGHVAKSIGGIMETPRTVEQSGPVYEDVSKAQQKEAVQFLNSQLFATPTWLVNKEINSLTGLDGLALINRAQTNILNRMLNTRTLMKLIEARARNGEKAYDLQNLFSDLRQGVWSELDTRKPVDVYRRNLQRSYLDILSGMIKTQPSNPMGGLIIILGGGPAPQPVAHTDIPMMVRAELQLLRSKIRNAGATTDQLTKIHYNDLLERIDNSLNPK